MDLVWHKTPAGWCNNIPEKSGLYIFTVFTGYRYSVIYVGQAKNLNVRINQHFSSSEENGDLKAYIRQRGNNLVIFWAEAPYDTDLSCLELYLFRYFRPCCNQIQPPAKYELQCNLP